MYHYHWDNQPKMGHEPINQQSSGWCFVATHSKNMGPVFGITIPALGRKIKVRNHKCRCHQTQIVEILKPKKYRTPLSFVLENFNESVSIPPSDSPNDGGRTS
jgi:hypothetical protein